MKVFQVAHEPKTGVLTVITNITNYLISIGIDCEIIVFHSNKYSIPEELKNFKIHSLNSFNTFGTGIFLMHLLINHYFKTNWIKKHIIDNSTNDKKIIFHFHNAWLSGALMPNNKNKNHKYVTSFHGIAGEHKLKKQKLRRFIHSLFLKRTIKKSDLILSVDKQTPVKCSNLFRQKSFDFFFLPNGSTSPINKPMIRNLNNNKITIAHIGIIDEGKGWKITAVAVKNLYNEGYKIEFNIIGKGPQENDALKWCNKNKHFAKFIGYKYDVKNSIMPNIDILSIPSETEGLPMVIIESLSAAIPVIATRVGGIPDIIIDNHNGFLINRDSKEIETKIKQIFNKKDLLPYLSKNALKTWEKEYSMKKIGNTLVLKYKELF